MTPQISGTQSTGPSRLWGVGAILLMPSLKSLEKKTQLSTSQHIQLFFFFSGASYKGLSVSVSYSYKGTDGFKLVGHRAVLVWKPCWPARQYISKLFLQALD